MDESPFNKQPTLVPYPNQTSNNIYEQHHHHHHQQQQQQIQPNAGGQSQLYQNYTTEQFMQISYQHQQNQINQNVNYFYNQNLNQHHQPPPTAQLHPQQAQPNQLPAYYQTQHGLNAQKPKLNIIPSSSVSSTPSTSTSSSSSSSLNANNAANSIQANIEPKDQPNRFNNANIYNHVYPNTDSFSNMQKSYSPSKRANESENHHSTNSPSENYVYGIKKNNPTPSLPKYGKPQLCITNLLVQTAKSRQIVKPQPRLAIVPPTNLNSNEHSSNMDASSQNFNNNTNYEYLYPQDAQKQFARPMNQMQAEFNPNQYQYQYQYQQSALPPPPQSIPPPPPIESSFNQQRPPPSIPQQAPYQPPPPPQRPVSPPNIPPPVQRNYNHYMDNFIHPNPSTHPNYVHHLPPPHLPPPPPPQLPPQIHYSTRPNTLLNTVLNNSFNSDRGKNINNSTNFDLESSFNNSTCSSVNNNSVYNNPAHLNCSNSANPNYQELLISPNLRTLFDRKKPPPPYPGKQMIQQQNQTDSLMDTNEDSNSVQIAPTPAVAAAANNLNQTINSSVFQSSSIIRTCSPQAFKFFMEQHAENVLKHHKAREFRRNQLETEMTKASLLPNIKDQMRRLLRQKETNYLRLRRAKMNKSMFEHIKVLGLGAFGEVDLVRKRDDPQRLYAMKILHKSDVFNRNQAAHVKAERDILAEADNEWVVKLWYSFQDDENLYFVMDYVPGGDLMNLLIKLQVFDEKLARFYIGELTCAIESVHSLGFIHRDIKPDNILIDKLGHIKLTDFGLCTGFHWTHNSKNYLIDDAYDRILERKLSNMNTASGDKRNNQRLMAHSLVGTPNYIAPEILSRKGYTKSCDWWSVGVILYEMLVGEPPFRDETALGTQSKVISWKQTLRIPDECNLTPEAKDLIFKLCTDAEHRFGAENIKLHAFFKNFDFGPNLRRSTAPYIPTINHPTDTSNFEPIDHSVLADRKIKIEEMHRQQQQKQNMNFYNSNYNSNERFNNHNDSIMNNSSAMVNPILYEFTFRRFFDEAYSSDNFFRINNEETNSFSKYMRNISKTSENGKDEEDGKRMDSENMNMDDKNKQAVSDKSYLSPSLTQMMASVSTTSKSPSKLAPETEKQLNRQYDQTEKLIDYTKKIQLKESTSDLNIIQSNLKPYNEQPINKIKFGYEATNNQPNKFSYYQNIKQIKLNHSDKESINNKIIDEPMNTNTNENDTNETSPTYV